MERLSGLTRKIPGLVLKVKGMTSAAFTTSRFVDPIYLRKKFDVVFIGGRDSGVDGLEGFNAELIDRSLAAYHRVGGKIVFLHDTFWDGDSERPFWPYFAKEMGNYQVMSDHSSWQAVKRKSPSGIRPAILTYPFELPEPFPVAETHAGQLFAAEKAILVGKTPDSTYYAESNGIGICEAGHMTILTDYEWKFLINVICHLSEGREN
jgi:hypothetical protein